MRVIHVARKPLSEASVAANILKHGTGALHVDATRIGDEGGTRRDGRATKPNEAGWENMRGHGIAVLDAGRWPANLVVGCPLDLDRGDDYFLVVGSVGSTSGGDTP